MFDELAKVICNNEINTNMTIATQSVAQSTNTYWITGYNTGGAVANILSVRIIDNESSIASNKDSVGVYCYTFGSPYTVEIKGTVYLNPKVGPNFNSIKKSIVVYILVDSNLFFFYLFFCGCSNLYI